MAATQLNSTTLAAAIDNSQVVITVASTASIAVGDLLVIRGRRQLEIALVQSIPVSGTLNVKRGVLGTAAVPAASGALVYTGAPSLFTQLYDNAVGLVGQTAALPNYLIPGAKATDGAGNEYILIDLTFSAFRGVGVLVSPDGLFTGKALAAGDVGTVAVVAEEATSAQYAWCQIFGQFSAAQFTSGSSLATSTGLVEPATTASTPAGGFLGRTTSLASSAAFARILGMKLTSAITTGTTAATSATGFVGDLWLNYPYLEHDVTSA